MKTVNKLIRYTLTNLDVAIWAIFLWAFWLYPWVEELQWGIMVWAFISIMVLKIRMVLLVHSLQCVADSSRELSAVLRSVAGKSKPADHHRVCQNYKKRF